jgi:hypothetical protein
LTTNIIPRLACVALAAVAACDGEAGSNGIAGPAGDAAGAYAATSFTLNQGGPEEDLLAQGSSITLTLLADGTTTGHMFVPAALTGEGDFDEDLDGTWTQADDVVRLEHTADTFLRDIDLVVSGNELTGQVSDPTFVLAIVFTKN